MNWDKYLKTDSKELELIQLITPLYFFNVVIYTADDFKRDFPTYLILTGLFIHGLVILVLIDKKGKFKIWGLRKIIEKALPFGLILTYYLSYYVGLQRGLDAKGLPIFLVTFIPMILYLFLIGYNFKSLSFLKDKRLIYNYGFIGLFVTAYIWVKYLS